MTCISVCASTNALERSVHCALLHDSSSRKAGHAATPRGCSLLCLWGAQNKTSALFHSVGYWCHASWAMAQHLPWEAWRLLLWLVAGAHYDTAQTRDQYSCDAVPRKLIRMRPRPTEPGRCGAKRRRADLFDEIKEAHAPILALPPDLLIQVSLQDALCANANSNFSWAAVSWTTHMCNSGCPRLPALARVPTH